MTANKTTRSGARRSGDDYQDLIAIEAMVEFLENPDKYSAIEFEADDVGQLDDIVRHRADGGKELYQVKYSLHPEQESDCYSWDLLLYRKVDKKDRPLPSLLARWIRSYLSCSSKGEITACLKTNRSLSADINILHNRHDKLIRYLEVSPEIMLKIESEGFSQEDIRKFFDNFKFDTEYLDFEVLESSLRQRLKRLGCPDSCLDSLQQSLHKWIRNGCSTINLTQIRMACDWHQLNPFDENFLIPQDYVVPDDAFYNEICSLLNSSAKCILISAGPGTGKSSFISYLKQNWIGGLFLRHHYFLSLDKNTCDRLRHDEILESLMQNMENLCPEGIRGAGNRNPSWRDFHNWLEECSAYCLSQDKKLVIAIDGLDHVWRSSSSIAELNNLLGYLFPIPNGVTVLLGTQPLAGDREPAVLVNHKSEIIEKALPMFSRNSLASWVLKNDILADSIVQVNDHGYSDFIDLLLSVSSGHPLVARYILQDALNSSGTVSLYSLTQKVQSSFSEIPKNLADYYNFVQGKCSSCGLFMLKCVTFRLRSSI